MGFDNVLQALKIVKPYYSDPSRNHIEARQDEIILGVTDRPLSPADAQKMIDLGCVQPENKAIKSADEYDPLDFWLIYP